MKIGKVIGTVVSTLKLEQYIGEKMLLVKILDPDGTETSETLVAFEAALWREGTNPNPGRPYAVESYAQEVCDAR